QPEASPQEPPKLMSRLATDPDCAVCSGRRDHGRGSSDQRFMGLAPRGHFVSLIHSQAKMVGKGTANTFLPHAGETCRVPWGASSPGVFAFFCGLPFRARLYLQASQLALL